MKRTMNFKNESNMKLKMKVRTFWDMTNSDCVLEQIITLNCENINELSEDLKNEIFNQCPFTAEVYRECHIEEFSDVERFSKVYNLILLCLGEMSSFEISIVDELKEHLTFEQLNNIYDAFSWACDKLYRQDINLQDRFLMSLSIYDSLIIPLSNFGFFIEDNEDGTYKFEHSESKMEIHLCINTKVIKVFQNEIWDSGILNKLLDVSKDTEYSVSLDWIDSNLELSDTN